MGWMCISPCNGAGQSAQARPLLSHLKRRISGAPGRRIGAAGQPAAAAIPATKPASQPATTKEASFEGLESIGIELDLKGSRGSYSCY